MAFRDYAGTAFEPFILPIIPRDAKLSPHSSLTPDRIGKVPGWRYDEGWGGFPKAVPWQKCQTTSKMLTGYAKWFEKDGFEEIVAIQTKRFNALDIDIDEPYIAGEIEKIAIKRFGATCIRMRPNSAKRLLLFRVAEDVTPLTKIRKLYRGPFDMQGAIEWLADGQQCLLEGLHPSGVHYEWVLGLTPVLWGAENVPLVSDATRAAFFAEVEEFLSSVGFTLVKGGGNLRLSGIEATPRTPVGPEHPDLCPDLDMLKDLITNYLPVDHVEFSTYDEWAAACVAIVTACGKDESFYEFFAEWCAGDPRNDESMIRGKWESVKDSAIGWSYLCNIAHEYGFVADIQQKFEALPVTGEQPSQPTPRLDGSYEGVIAAEFVRAHARKGWIFIPTTKNQGGEWRRFSGGIWSKDFSILHDVALACQRVGLAIRANPQATSAQLKKAEQMFSTRTAEAVLRAVKADPRIIVDNADLDDRPIVFGVPGGTVNALGEFEAGEASPDYLLTTRTAYAPDFEADCPRFKGLIANLCNHDPELIDFFWQLLGYTMSGLCTEQVFVFLLGKAGREGKTTFTTIMQLVLGDYATPIRNTMFLKGRGDDARFAVAALKGKRFAYANELELGQRWASERLKEVTGGGEMTIERKYAEPERMRIQPVIWLMGNNLPIFPPADTALQRRMVLIEAKTPVSESEDMRGFAYDVARTEGPAIMGHLVKAMRAYLRRGKLEIPASIAEQVAEHFHDDDLIIQFVEECCEVNDDLRVTGNALYGTYLDWAKHTAGLQRVLGRTTFMRLISDHPGLRKIGHIVRIRHVDGSDPSSPRGFKGIGIRDVVSPLRSLSR